MISTMIITILSILLWTNLFKQTYSKADGFKYRLKWLTPILTKIDFKPINCAFCLAFWCGVILSVIFQDITYMGIFLFFNLKE